MKISSKLWSLPLVLIALVVGCSTTENPTATIPEIGQVDSLQVGATQSYPGYCFYLNVPWMSQMPPKRPGDSDEVAWGLTNNCGQACSVMLGGYFNGGSVAPWVIDAENDWMHCPKPYGCQTGAGTVQNLLWGFHRLHSDYRTGNQPDDVVAEGARGRPVIVGVRTGMSTNGRAHWMLFVGWDRTFMYFHDPGRSQPGNGNPATGGRFVRYTVNQFYASWNSFPGSPRQYIPVYR